MDKTLLVQTQIRQNAQEVSNALTEMRKWEEQAKKKDEKVKIKSTHMKSRPIRSGIGTVPVKYEAVKLNKSVEPILFPAVTIPLQSEQSNYDVPKARGDYIIRDPEDVERERGNSEFKLGNFTAAVKSYTKCLGLKVGNYVAFSNRAMAYLKLKEYSRAEADCSCALSLQPNHVKSLLRRASARSSLGMHRAALKDLLKAADIEPTSKQVRIDLKSVRESLRSAVNRAPLVPIQMLEKNLPISQALLPDLDKNQDNINEPVTDHQQDLKTIKKEANVDMKKLTELGVKQGVDYRRIMIESDSEDEIELQKTKKIVEDNVKDTAVSKFEKNVKTKKKKPKNTTPRKLLISSSYELERFLQKSKWDVLVLSQLFSTFKTSDAEKLLASAMEPEVLYLLFKGIWVYYGRSISSQEQKGKWCEENWMNAFNWVKCITSLSCFQLLYSLLLEKQRSEVESFVLSMNEPLQEFGQEFSGEWLSAYFEVREKIVKDK